MRPIKYGYQTLAVGTSIPSIDYNIYQNQ